MFKIGDHVKGLTYDENGEVEVLGTFVARTDDPEEIIQDIIVRTKAGEIKYCDEQTVSLTRPFPYTEKEVEAILAASDFTTEQYEALYAFYTESGEMPYGVAKARDGDPYQWIYAKLEKAFSHD